MAVLEQVSTGRISAEARQIRFGPAALTLLAGLLFGVGWLAAKACAVLWAGMTWTWVAVRIGWQEGAARPELSAEDGPG